METPKFITYIGWESLRTQKTTLLYLIENSKKHGLDSHMCGDLDGLINLIDGLQDYAVDELGIPEMSVFDFEEEENREQSTKEEIFARDSAKRIFETRIESEGFYLDNLDNEGQTIPRAFFERIIDDSMHADIIKAQINAQILNDLKKVPAEFQTDGEGNYIFDEDMYEDYGGIMEKYCRDLWEKVPKPVVIRCERCNEKLNPAKAVWLELSITDGKYYPSGCFPQGHESQGEFSFGKDCARTVITKDPGNENKKYV
jgi:hypothetical protein